MSNNMNRNSEKKTDTADHGSRPVSFGASSAAPEERNRDRSESDATSRTQDTITSEASASSERISAEVIGFLDYMKHNWKLVASELMVLGMNAYALHTSRKPTEKASKTVN